MRSTPPIAALLLAAGESSRMGQSKALLSWGTTSLMDHQVTTLALYTEITRIVVVLGHKADELRAALHHAKIQIAINHNYREGRASSLVTGAKALTDLVPVSVLVCNVDQPLAPEIIAPLIAAYRACPDAILRPVHAGRTGHPLIVPSDIAPELLLVREKTLGLRAVTARHKKRIRSVPVTSGLATLNLNTPAEFRAARAEYAL
ncbi:MAG: nucleotidyltransferase family protein [Acidobacteriota bacterium]|nr:nucleotidyltransferase family protein [Acidobacteriota bacterium]